MPASEQGKFLHVAVTKSNESLFHLFDRHFVSFIQMEVFFHGEKLNKGSMKWKSTLPSGYEEEEEKH